ncbi:MAG TPA: phosphate-starvation-inducible PsiE family protein [Lactobacillaceae bacterium]|jgi:protein PsiE
MLHKQLAQLFEWILDVMMLLMGLLMLGFLIREGINLLDLILTADLRTDFDEISKSALALFLFFELTSISREYFVKDAHISLESFIFIGVTALVRTILVYHSNSQETLLLSLAILVLVVAFILYRYSRQKITNLAHEDARLNQK